MLLGIIGLSIILIQSCGKKDKALWMLQGISDQLKNYIQPASFNQNSLGNSNLEINLSNNYSNTSTFQESTLGCLGISFQYNADNKVQGAACLVKPTPENPSNPGNQCNTVSCLMQSILNKISNGGTETGGKGTNTCTGQNKGCLELQTDANGGYSLISLEDISGAPIPT
ncbi:MAG: hypothetical protein KatS3mg129_2166 [Leptospiraceae bacterium]|nr:MAG: hypothetical protein KatS3mg129_2166 [Leptospiraceae bacterium]